MDKRIIDALAGFGLITVNVNAADYKDVDDLIAKGVVTVPGAKQKIYELIGSMDGAATAEDIIIEIEETVEETAETVVEETAETVVEETAETVVEETVETVVEETVETVVEETVETVVEETVETVVEETVETVVEETVETVVEETPKKKKSTKKSE